jgi:5'-AMP-activated protein kinase regulatory gamma subunit
MGGGSSTPKQTRKKGDLLSTTTIAEVIPEKQKLLKIDSRLIIPKTLQILVNHNIYSAPVVDIQNNQLLGFIDMVDIVECLIQIISETELLGEDFDIYTLDAKEKQFSEQGTMKVTDLSKRNPLYTLEGHLPLVKALFMFKEKGVHRVCVGKGNSIQNVLTESAVIDWLNKNANSFSTLFSKTVDELNLGLKDVISIKENEKAIEAFKLMSKHRITAVAVVDDNGVLKTAVSAKDLRIISAQRKMFFARLYDTTRNFAAEAHKGIKDIDTSQPTLSCTKKSTLGQVVSTLATYRRHRVFIIDNEGKPIGVISLGDVLATLLKT